MSALAPILAGSRQPGVHRLVSSASTVEDLREEAEAAGWMFAYVDGADLATRADVMVRLGEVLDFPAYYTGRSLDGLHDCLLDLPVPTVLVWAGWDALAAAHPPDLRRLLLVLADRAAERPAFEALLLGEGPDDTAPAL